jgi:putative endonuclease
VNAGERRARRYYRLRGYRIVGTNVRAGRYEIDLIVRRGRQLTFVEVKRRTGSGFGGALGAVDAEKRRRVRRAAQTWLTRHPQEPGLRIGFEVMALEQGRLERREATLEDL